MKQYVILALTLLMISMPLVYFTKLLPLAIIVALSIITLAMFELKIRKLEAEEALKK